MTEVFQKIVAAWDTRDFGEDADPYLGNLPDSGGYTREGTSTNQKLGYLDASYFDQRFVLVYQS